MSMRGMVRGWLGLLVLLLASPAWSAATLTGMVSLNRERGTPVAGVEISTRGANVVTTGNDGVFVLTFREGHPGQDVSVRVKRTGWDVVNDILLDQRLPETANARTFEIIVCLSAEREQLRAEFYRLKGNQAVEQTYRTKLAELEGRQAAERQLDLNNLGNLSSDENRNVETRNQYEEALDLFRTLAKTNPDVYLPDVAQTLNNLGLLSSAENRNAEARKRLEEALGIFRLFAARAPATYQPRVRLVEDNLRSLPR